MYKPVTINKTNDKSNTWIYVSISVLFLMVIGGGLFLMNKK